VSEEDDKVYRMTLDSLTRLSAVGFVPRSGTSVLEDADGNVYVAGAQVFVYDKHAKMIGVLETPERPGSLAFGGDDRKTLYVGARGSLYAISVRAPGR
jgi:hypothetical protein